MTDPATPRPRNQSSGRSASPLKCRADPLDSYPVKTLLRTPLRMYAALACGSLGAAAAVVALAQPSLGDYIEANTSNPDNAAPAIHALIHGHIGRVPSVQPVMGPVSILIRAPFAALGHALGGRKLEYRLGAPGWLRPPAAPAPLPAPCRPRPGAARS